MHGFEPPPRLASGIGLRAPPSPVGKGALVVVQSPDGSIEFRFFRPGVRAAAVAGDFNAWQVRCFAMRPAGNGWWVYRLHLAPGTYQFKYWSDGEWFPDYAAFGLERGPFGWNSVLVVGAQHEVKRVASGHGRDAELAAVC